MTAADTSVDLIVVGGGPAGLAAAVTARRLGASVCVLEREQAAPRTPLAGWLGPAGAALCDDLGVAAATAASFAGLTLHTPDFQQHLRIDDPEVRGQLVDRVTFDEALLQAAGAAGAKLRLGATLADVTVTEQGVDARLASGETLAGRVLIVADGAGSTTAPAVGLQPAAHHEPGLRCVQVVRAAAAPPGLDVVLGDGGAVHLALIVRSAASVRLSVLGRGTAEVLLATAEELVTAAIGAGVVPADATETVSANLSPAGMALELESHVGKHSLLIGDAGGFVAALSGEGLYPALRSGVIAAEAAHAALAAPVLQDALATFETRWRETLAEYLRSPNTDLALLLPLVFKNEQMARRVARAVVLGQDL